ncbi:unnamed protein product [Trichobilharzia regenti]|nr:unnamed protein product [Trichobilharzia regenti]
MFLEYINDETVNRRNNKRIRLIKSLGNRELENKFSSVPRRYFKLHLVDDASADGITAIISTLRGDLPHRLSYAAEFDLDSESEESRELEAILLQESLDV